MDFHAEAIATESGATLRLTNAKKFGEYLRSMVGRKLIVSVKQKRAIRSENQNRFYHGIWLPIIADELGYLDPEEVCRSLKVHLGYCKIVDDKITKKQRYEVESTSDMNKAEMSDFLRKVEMFVGSEFNITLPSTEDETNSTKTS